MGRGDVAERRAFAGPIARLAVDREGILEAYEGRAQVAEQIVTKADLIKRIGQTTRVPSPPAQLSGLGVLGDGCLEGGLITLLSERHRLAQDHLRGDPSTILVGRGPDLLEHDHVATGGSTFSAGSDGENQVTGRSRNPRQTQRSRGAKVVVPARSRWPTGVHHIHHDVDAVLLDLDLDEVVPSDLDKVLVRLACRQSPLVGLPGLKGRLNCVWDGTFQCFADARQRRQNAQDSGQEGLGAHSVEARHGTSSPACLGSCLRARPLYYAPRPGAFTWVDIGLGASQPGIAAEIAPSGATPP